MTFDYSDGDQVEERLLEILAEASDLGSSAWIARDLQERSWPIRYHLAPERANLVRHLEFDGLDVLELGAGLGGVSRYLAEEAGSLTVAEGSTRRFRGLELRLRDLDGWRGRAARIDELEPTPSYDVVCLVGVLEYAEMYHRAPAGSSPFEALIRHAAAHLRPDGVLLLAIENRFGLKYWAGLAEDQRRNRAEQRRLR